MADLLSPLLAYAAGALTILSPCVLPLVPIVLGSAAQAHPRGPLALAGGLVASFTLTDGRTISVERNWKGSGPESRFLHAAHRGSCKYFRVALGPDFNEAHHNHFHLDRGILWTCR